MKYIRKVFFGLLIILIVSGCSTKGAKYNPNFNSINELKDNNLKQMSIQKNNLKDDMDETIPFGRGSNKMTSPYGGSFSTYLKISLEEHLKQASLYDNNSNIVINPILLENKLNTGITIGEADLSARFIILINNNEVYNKVYTIHHEWESSFMAAKAIPYSVKNYQIATQKLIDKFLFDKNVLKILK